MTATSHTDGDSDQTRITLTVSDYESLRNRAAEYDAMPGGAIPMLLWCPNGHRHIDEGKFATKPHHTHACQTCGIVWRPAKVDTVGVRFLPGYKNDALSDEERV